MPELVNDGMYTMEDLTDETFRFVMVRIPEDRLALRLMRSAISTLGAQNNYVYDVNDEVQRDKARDLASFFALVYLHFFDDTEA
jgi:hypothetical protein